MNTSVDNGLSAVRLHEGFSDFYAPPQPGDMDLVELIKETLFQNGLQEQANAAFINHPLVIEAHNKQPHVQRWLLNRYWVQQLTSINIDTFTQRLNLIAGGTEEDWYRLFVQYVVPFLVEHQLPKVI